MHADRDSVASEPLSLSGQQAVPSAARGAQPRLRESRIWGVTSFFDPGGSGQAAENFRIFSARIRAQGLPLLTVELAVGARPFTLDPQMSDQHIRRRTDDLLWHKESLLNIGIDALPETCDQVVWLDADVLFDRPGWVAQTSAALRDYPVVQPFSEAIWLAEGAQDPPANPRRGHGEGAVMPGMAATMAHAPNRRSLLQDYFRHGHPGFAWAARRDLLARHRLYDRHVMGGGDVTLAHAFYGDRDYWRGMNMASRDMSAPERAAMARWSGALHADVKGNIGHVDGRILHLWHGPLAQRGYTERWRILKSHDFDPERDVTLGRDGCLCWAPGREDLQAAVRAYFAARTASAQTGPNIAAPQQTGADRCPATAP
ncbi:hypothetical protein [Poseidonocella sedimentorum]|uniref:Uncharacterized protein n=1 Tax=Poseidonocella sedimentorum TaxID=871652 RepID=A0A1I6DL58_9RHOB|nr:hypothetical protein [Poseidonocella sedimentorum]SFR06180.1 hypothetical protein SAMN04515673_10456 [Poseidonocella sedimentorum]